VVLDIARLIGRQLAREDFERLRATNDKQNEASIEDQFRICRKQAKRRRWGVAGTYQDAAISGASVILRPGIQQLVQDAQAGRFAVVLAEALDRISRDQADVATLYKHLKFAGVAIVTLAEGEITELHVGMNIGQIDGRLGETSVDLVFPCLKLRQTRQQSAVSSAVFDQGDDLLTERAILFSSRHSTSPEVRRVWLRRLVSSV
jgi:hypothetical protein